ncbi:MAG: S8 family serine peptidase, partial [Planctomycetaceae bacterium]|nr:S8 family serine peptidase [Planctomycetaceae bacterium]
MSHLSHESSADEWSGRNQARDLSVDSRVTGRTCRRLYQITQGARRWLHESRRMSARRRIAVGQLCTPETMEARLLLATDLRPALYDTNVISEVGAGTVDSYFVKFSGPQSTEDLQSVTGAADVTESAFVDFGYTVDFAQGLTLQSAADRFSGLAGFEYLHPNIQYTAVPEAIPNDPLFANQWHLVNNGQNGGVVGIDANVQAAWDIATGQGVTIGIVDDGLETTHEDLGPNVNTTIDFDWNDNDTDPNPGPLDFHGTAVAGVAAARGNNGVGVSGVAWDAELVGLRLIAAGNITDRAIAEALTHQSQVIDIYNNSWGPGPRDVVSSFGSGPQTVAALEDGAVNGRGGLGVIRVNSAGNGGPGTNTNYFRPSGSRFTITVGAVVNTGVLASYSTPGAAVVLVAPSGPPLGDIWTTDRTGNIGYDLSNYTSTFNGTSSAAPVVSGVVALMLDANPELSYRDVVDILVNSSDQIDPTNPGWERNGAGLWVSHDYGFGLVDAAEAVSMAQNHVPLSPEQSFSSGTQVVNTPIPDLGSVTRTYTVSSADAITSLEYVELVFNATHQFIGDLEIVLTSPDGTRSVMAESRLGDPGQAYSNWVFSSIHHYGESSEGVWTLTVTDNQAQDAGTIDSFELRFYGTNATHQIIESGGNTVVSDAGISDFFDVVLSEQPSSDVVVKLTSSDTAEVTLSQSSLTFTPTNWNRPQRITVNGVQDLIRDFDKLTNVVASIDTALSDPAFAQASNILVSVRSVDDDYNLPHKPVLTAPDLFPGTQSPEFQWTPVDNAETYDLTVTNAVTGAVVQQAMGILLPRFTFPSLFVDGIYSAIVVGVNTDGVSGPASDPLLFAIGEVTAPTAPIITSPGANELVTTNRPVVTWLAVPGAVSYEIYFDSAGQITRVIDPGTPAAGNTLSYTPTEDLREGANSVWVRAFNALNDPGEWSEVVNFTVDAFPTPDRPFMTAPSVTVTTNAFPRFAWTTGGASRFQLWVAHLRPGTGVGGVEEVWDRVIHLTDFAGTSYTHFNALPEGLHRAWVRGINAAGEYSEWSPVNEFSISVDAPTQPVLQPIGTTTDITPLFRWDGTADRFDLWVNNISTGQSQVIRNTTLTGNSYESEVALEQGRYRAWIQGYNALEERGPWSAAIVFTVDVPAPIRPKLTGPVETGATAETPVTTRTPTFAWTAVPDGITYELWVNHLDTRTARIVHETALTGESYTVTDALPQGSYKAWVRARNSAGEPSEWSAAFAFVVDVPTPTVPVITGPTPNSVGSIEDTTPTITWTAVAAAATYDLQLQVTSSGASVVNATGLTGTSYTVTQTLPEIAHRVRVRAVNTAGELGDWSDWYSLRIDEPNATTPVALLPVGTVTNGNVIFQWQHTPGNTEYELLVRDPLNQDSIIIRVTNIQLDLSGTRASLARALPSGTYRFWIRAFNSRGTASSWSNSLAFNVVSADTAELLN